MYRHAYINIPSRAALLRNIVISIVFSSIILCLNIHVIWAYCLPTLLTNRMTFVVIKIVVLDNQSLMVHVYNIII